MELVSAVLGSPKVGLDVDQIADAIWLAQFLTGDEHAVMVPEPTVAPAEEPALQPAPESATAPSTTPRAAEPTPRQADPEPAQRPIDIARAPQAGGGVLPDAVRFRSPAASALTRQLELARAIRPLGWRSPRPGGWRLLEEVTADRIARTGLWLAELAPETEPALDLVLVVDDSPRLHVWRRVTRELIDVLRSSGVFRTTTTWMISSDQPGVVLRSVGGAVHASAHHLIDPAQRTAMLVISDFAGPLWKTDAGLACVRLWSQRMMVALVSLVPQRSWGRTLLGTLPATRLASLYRGRPSAALRSEAAVVADAIPIPVVSIDPASLGTWARLVAGDAQVRGRGVLALPDTRPETHARYTAAAMHAEGSGDLEDMLAALTDAARAPHAAAIPRDARERVERFCETHRPEVVELAAALVSAPLELSVMLVVQRAVAPRTGTLELAEIIDSGLFEIEPPRPGDDEVRFRIADDLRDHLSPRASIGEHLRVLEAVGAYLRDHLGSSIDFEALVVDPSRPVGAVAEKDRRFARMFVAELRRLGVDTDALAHLDPPPIAEFTNRWVVVVGTGVTKLPTAVQLAAEALGRELAQRGFGLRTWGWAGVDSVVGHAFANTLGAGSAKTRERLIFGAERQVFSKWAEELVGSVVAVILIGGRGGTYNLRDHMRAAQVPVVPFRGSGGTADNEATLQHLEHRPEIRNAIEANDEAASVVNQVCAIVVAPARARAFAQLRKGLYVRQPAFARMLHLGLDGRVTIAGSLEQLHDAAATEIARIASTTDLAVLILAFELLAQLRAWEQVAQLAASRTITDAVTAADEAARATTDVNDRLGLWHHIALTTEDLIAMLNAVEAAAATGDRSVALGSLDELQSKLDAKHGSMSGGGMTRTDEPRPSFRLLGKLVSDFLWKNEPASALQGARCWLALVPGNKEASEHLLVAAERSPGRETVYALLALVDLVAAESRAAVLHTAVDQILRRPLGIPHSELQPAAERLLQLAPGDPRGLEAMHLIGLFLRSLASRVCRVVGPSNPARIRTGFLIAPDIVLTAWEGHDLTDRFSTGMAFEFDGGTVVAHAATGSFLVRVDVSHETELALMRITPPLGERYGWFDLSAPILPRRGDVVSLIELPLESPDARLVPARIVDTDDTTIAYDLEKATGSTHGASGGHPVVNANGQLVAVYYRREVGAAEARTRRAIAASCIASNPVVRKLLARKPVGSIAALEELATAYDRLREQQRTHARTARLDELVDQAVQAAADALPDDAKSFWHRGTLGARAIALAVCMKSPAVAPIEIIVEGMDQPRSAHEQWTALRALSWVVEQRHPLDADPAIAVLIRHLRSKDGFGEDRTILAQRVLERYLERCTLSPGLAARLDVIEEWLRAGQRTAARSCIAFVGGVTSSPWMYGDLAEALGGELARQGCEVIAAAGREVGTRATVGAERAGGMMQLASEGGEVILAHADCVIVMAGKTTTAWECDFARALRRPMIALAFTGGVAASISADAERDLAARDVPPELLSPLRVVPVGDDVTRLIVRVVNVVLARTASAPAIESSSRRASQQKVIDVLATHFAADGIERLARELDPELDPVLARHVSLSIGSRQDGTAHQTPADVARYLVTRCAAVGVLDRLLLAMVRRQPDRLVEFTQELNVYPWTSDPAIDESILRFLKLGAYSWASACWNAGSCICEVRVDGRPVGTGFLVGSDVVLTSFHVIGDHVLRAVDAHTRLAFVFDRISVLGSVSPGVSVPAAQFSWLIAASRPAPGELADLYRGEPADNELDFAMIRLSREVGVEPRHEPAHAWLRNEAPPASSQTVAIPHYTDGRALTLAVSDSGAYELSQRGARAHYGSGGLRGSSGAPVFDAATWKLLALDQGLVRDGRRQGIPIAHIVQHPDVQAFLK